MKEKEIIKIYDKAVLSHEEYKRMNKKIADFVCGDVLEVGAGTGLLTEELLKKKIKL